MFLLRFGGLFGIFCSLPTPEKHTEEAVRTDLLAKFHVTNKVLHNTLLFNLKLGFFRLKVIKFYITPYFLT